MSKKKKVQNKGSLARSSMWFKLHRHLKTTKGINSCSKFTTTKKTAWLNGSRGALFLLLLLRSGIYPRGIQIGAIVLSQGIHLGAEHGCFQWAMLTSLSGDRKGPSLPGRGREEGGKASIWIIWIAPFKISYQTLSFRAPLSHQDKFLFLRLKQWETMLTLLIKKEMTLHESIFIFSIVQTCLWTAEARTLLPTGRQNSTSTFDSSLSDVPLPTHIWLNKYLHLVSFQ